MFTGLFKTTACIILNVLFLSRGSLSASAYNSFDCVYPEQAKYDVIPATVLPTDFQGAHYNIFSFMIDKGSMDGVHSGMAVVSEKGFIGIVSSCADDTAYVSLTSLFNSRIVYSDSKDVAHELNVISSFDYNGKRIAITSEPFDETLIGTSVYVEKDDEYSPVRILLGDIVYIPDVELKFHYADNAVGFLLVGMAAEWEVGSKVYVLSFDE